MHVPLDLLHQVSLPAWAALLRAHGARRAPKTLDQVREAFRSASPPLASAARTLRTLTRDEARPAVLEAAGALGVDARGWARGEGAAELVAALLARAAKDPAAAEVIEAAKYRLCRREPQAPGRRYVAKVRAREASPRTTGAELKKLAAAIERANEARHATGKVDVTVTRDETAAGVTFTLEVVRPDPIETRFVRTSKGAPDVVRLAPVEVDRLVVERAGSGPWTLWVWTAAPELLNAYRAAVGAALFGDAALFTTAGPISLRALQHRQADALDVKHAKSARLKNARVVAILWDPGREETIAIAGRNVLAALERDDLPNHGQLVAARVRLDFDDGPVDVTLRVPNVVHWEPCAHDAAIRAFLGSLGLDEPARDDLVTLAPHDHPAWRWRAGIGDAAFEWLLAHGCFEESTSRALAHPEHAAAGRILLAFALSAGARGRSRHYAVPEEGFDVGARVVGDEDLVTYRLNVGKLARLLGREIGVETGGTSEAGESDGEGAAEPIERGTLVDIGPIALSGARARLFLVIAAGRTKGLAKRLRALSGGAHPVLVVLRGGRGHVRRGQEDGCIVVELASLAGPHAALRGAIAKALGMGDAAGLTARAPAGTRIAIERKTGRIEIDAVEMVAMAESAKKLVRTLVEAGGKPVAGARCDERVAPARKDPGAAKAAKTRFVAGATASFGHAGREAPGDLDEMIVGTGVGYRVTVACWIG